MKTRKIVLYGLISALYACLALATPNISFGQAQIRISEVLMVFCIFDKKFILPLTLGCFFANTLGVLMGVDVLTLDIIFGTLATYISGVLMNKLNKIVILKKELVSLMVPTLINGIIIGLELTFYLYPGENFFQYFILNFCYVAIGEIISVYILGVIMYQPLKGICEYILTTAEEL